MEEADLFEFGWEVFFVGVLTWLTGSLFRKEYKGDVTLFSVVIFSGILTLFSSYYVDIQGNEGLWFHEIPSLVMLIILLAMMERNKERKSKA